MLGTITAGVSAGGSSGGGGVRPGAAGARRPPTEGKSRSRCAAAPRREGRPSPCPATGPGRCLPPPSAEEPRRYRLEKREWIPRSRRASAFPGSPRQRRAKPRLRAAAASRCGRWRRLRGRRSRARALTAGRCSARKAVVELGSPLESSRCFVTQTGSPGGGELVSVVCKTPVNTRFLVTFVLSPSKCEVLNAAFFVLSGSILFCLFYCC